MEQNQEPAPKPDESPTEATPSFAHSDTLQEEKPASRKWKIFREYVEAIIIALLLAFTIRVFIVQAFKIPSGSMIPTLLIGDHILVYKLSYGFQWPKDCKMVSSFPPITCYAATSLLEFGKPERGDIIVFRYPEDEDKDFIKRVVGIPGDRIEIRDKVVFVNGTPLKEDDYTQRIDHGIIDGNINPRDNFGPISVPQESYFVMGDNRDQSLDSRFWGFVKADKIKGRAFLVYWSWNGQGPWQEWVRWERIGKGIGQPTQN